MARIVDLLHGPQELRYCSLLALVLDNETGARPILRGLLGKIVSERWTKGKGTGAGGWGSGKKPPFSLEDLDGLPLRCDFVQVEEWVRGRNGREGRLDLTVRFHVGRNRHLLAIEAKVGAPGAHGDQMERCRHQFATWDGTEPDGSAERNRLFGMLTVSSPEEFQWTEKDESSRRMVDFWLRWEDIGKIIEEVFAKSIKDQVSVDNRTILRSFREGVRRLTVQLGEYRNLMKLEHPPFPVVIDALEAFIKKLSAACKTKRINWEPAGLKGPLWEKESPGYNDNGRYSCGGWCTESHVQEWRSFAEFAGFLEERKLPAIAAWLQGGCEGEPFP